MEGNKTEEEGTVRGAPRGVPDCWFDITNATIRQYHTPEQKNPPGCVSHLYVRIHYRQAEPPYQATQARPRATFHGRKNSARATVWRTGASSGSETDGRRSGGWPRVLWHVAADVEIEQNADREEGETSGADRRDRTGRDCRARMAFGATKSDDCSRFGAKQSEAEIATSRFNLISFRAGHRQRV